MTDLRGSPEAMRGRWRVRLLAGYVFVVVGFGGFVTSLAQQQQRGRDALAGLDRVAATVIRDDGERVEVTVSDGSERRTVTAIDTTSNVLELEDAVWVLVDHDGELPAATFAVDNLQYGDLVASEWVKIGILSFGAFVYGVPLCLLSWSSWRCWRFLDRLRSIVVDGNAITDGSTTIPIASVVGVVCTPTRSLGSWRAFTIGFSDGTNRIHLQDQSPWFGGAAAKAIGAEFDALHEKVVAVVCPPLTARILEAIERGEVRTISAVVRVGPQTSKAVKVDVCRDGISRRTWGSATPAWFVPWSAITRVQTVAPWHTGDVRCLWFRDHAGVERELLRVYSAVDGVATRNFAVIADVVDELRCRSTAPAPIVVNRPAHPFMSRASIRDATG